MELRAFHSDKAIKAKYLTRLRAHAAADEIIHGVGWNDGKGCAIGCTLNNYNHAAYETELGIPQSLAKLEDTLFEGLKNGESKKFPIAFLNAIKPGADLSLVTPKFLLAVQKRNLRRMKGKNADVEKAIEGVIKVLMDWTKIGKADVSAAAWSAWSAESAAAAESARSAWSAWSAESAAAAARSARSAESAAAWSAWSAESAAAAARSARSAESAAAAAWSAESAAWSAARSAARSAESARSAEYRWMAMTLLKLLREAK